MKHETVKIFQKKKKNILEVWMKNQIEDETLREDLISNDDLRTQSEDLLNALVNALSEKNLDEPESNEFASFIEILSVISIARARKGYSPRETAAYVQSLKDAMLEILRDIKDADERFDIAVKVGKLFDYFSVTAFETFIKGREEVILRQTDEISEISTPVIQVWEGILALPIIGTLDSSRTQVVMENLLQRIVESGSDIAILDISGVPAVDSLVAQHLIKTVSATRLMGAECIISGIRPEIAQTVVHLGIDLSDIITKSTLASALKHAFSMMHMEVNRKQKVNLKPF
jgi:rsbT co-antagonist protein RsbR